MSKTDQVKIYDTTLRDGTQAEDIAFSSEDKIRIAQKLNEFGIDYIEGGWPGSNPKDLQFFREVKKIPFSHARIVAFGSTCRAGTPPEKDSNIQALIDADTKVVTIFGKSWDIHPLEALNITLEQNLEIIHQSVRYLKKRFRRSFTTPSISLTATKIILPMPSRPFRPPRRPKQIGSFCVIPTEERSPMKSNRSSMK